MPKKARTVIVVGDARHIPLEDESVQTAVTSPPYWSLRDYNLKPSTWANGEECCLGLEAEPESFVEHIVEVFREVRRVLRKDGIVWLNLGDSYCGSGINDGSVNPGLSKAAQRGDVQGRRPSYSSKRIPRGSGRWGGGNVSAPGLKPKDLVGIPWMVAFALRADGWWLRKDIIWFKPNPMPESVRDRPTSSHEYLFLLSKSARYFYNAEAIREPAAETSLARWAQNVEAQKGSNRANGGVKINGSMKAVGGPRRSDKQRGHSRRHAGFNDRWDHLSKEEQSAYSANKRSVWTIATQPFSDAHFATFPQKLVEPCILAGSRGGDLVLDPFAGSGTVGLVAARFGRRFLGLDLSPEYAAMATKRLHGVNEPLPGLAP